jgi:hypothetical protein
MQAVAALPMIEQARRREQDHPPLKSSKAGALMPRAWSFVHARFFSFCRGG